MSYDNPYSWSSDAAAADRAAYGKTVDPNYRQNQQAQAPSVGQVSPVSMSPPIQPGVIGGPIGGGGQQADPYAGWSKDAATKAQETYGQQMYGQQQAAQPNPMSVLQQVLQAWGQNQMGQGMGGPGQGQNNPTQSGSPGAQPFLNGYSPSQGYGSGAGTGNPGGGYSSVNNGKPDMMPTLDRALQGWMQNSMGTGNQPMGQGMGGPMGNVGQGLPPQIILLIQSILAQRQAGSDPTSGATVAGGWPGAPSRFR